MQVAETAGGLSFQADTQVLHRPLASLGNQQRMLKLAAFSHLGRPQEIKTNNGLGYITQTTQDFLEKWGIWHKMGIPYNPTGQPTVERTCQTFKTVLNKKKGVRKHPPVI